MASWVPFHAFVLVAYPTLQLYTVATEIDERHQFLEDMRALGAGSQYEAQINAEIHARVQELHMIDQARAVNPSAFTA